MGAPTPDDAARVAALERLDLLGDDRPEARFDRIARLTTRLFDAPIAYVSLIDHDTLHLIACVGMPMADVPRAETLCTHTLSGDEPLVLEDARLDPRFADNPYVRAGAVFYAGRPLHDPVTGHPVGTICVADVEPRQFDAGDLATLDDVGRLVEAEFTRGQLVEVATALEAQRAATDRAARRLSTVLSSTVEAIVGMDGDGQATFVNAAASRMFGHAGADLLGRRLHDVVQHHDRDGSVREWSDSPTAMTLADGRARRITDDWYWRGDGSGFAAETSVAPAIADGSVVGVVATVLDVTRRRAAEGGRRALVGSASHELRTPLTAVLGSLDLLHNGVVGELDDEARRVVGMARSNAAQLARLVTELLDLDALHRGNLPVDFESVAIAELVAAAVAAVHDLAEESAVRVEVRGDDDGHLVADADRIVQVLGTLLETAIRSSSAAAVVVLEVDGDDRGTTFRVIDGGRGIPAATLGTIFEPFGRVGDTGDDGQDGRGLGLPVAASLVEAHGGRTWVDSEVGVGSTFHVWIPREARSDADLPGPTGQHALEGASP